MQETLKTKTDTETVEVIARRVECKFEDCKCTLNDAAATLRALAAERDKLRAENERLQLQMIATDGQAQEAYEAQVALKAENERLREALFWLDNVVEKNVTHTGKAARVQDEKGVWHSGPAADVCQKVLRGLQQVARVALEATK